MDCTVREATKGALLKSALRGGDLVEDIVTRNDEVSPFSEDAG